MLARRVMQRDTGVRRVLLADDDIRAAVVVIESLDVLSTLFLRDLAVDEHSVAAKFLAQRFHWCRDVAE